MLDVHFLLNSPPFFSQPPFLVCSVRDADRHRHGNVHSLFCPPYLSLILVQTPGVRPADVLHKNSAAVQGIDACVTCMQYTYVTRIESVLLFVSLLLLLGVCF
jgi:hypothetical protein